MKKKRSVSSLWVLVSLGLAVSPAQAVLESRSSAESEALDRSVLVSGPSDPAEDLPAKQPRATLSGSGKIQTRLAPKADPLSAEKSMDDSLAADRYEFGRIRSAHPAATQPAGVSPVVKTVSAPGAKKTVARPATVVNPGRPATRARRSGALGTGPVYPTS